jgi:hypothetical protein
MSTNAKTAQDLQLEVAAKAAVVAEAARIVDEHSNAHEFNVALLEDATRAVEAADAAFAKEQTDASAIAWTRAQHAERQVRDAQAKSQAALDRMRDVHASAVEEHDRALAELVRASKVEDLERRVSRETYHGIVDPLAKRVVAVVRELGELLTEIQRAHVDRVTAHLELETMRTGKMPDPPKIDGSRTMLTALRRLHADGRAVPRLALGAFLPTSRIDVWGGALATQLLAAYAAAPASGAELSQFGETVDAIEATDHWHHAMHDLQLKGAPAPPPPEPPVGTVRYNRRAANERPAVPTAAPTAGKTLLDTKVPRHVQK